MRPRGFIEDWTPSNNIPLDEDGEPKYSHSPADIVASVRDILERESDILPLTLRQIFYMLVSNENFGKTEKEYKRLCETMNKARRAHLVPMGAFRDDGPSREDVFSWDDEENLIDSFKGWATEFRLDRQEGQDTRLMIWCEAGGMVPQLASAAEPYGISVMSSGGFDSLTTKHDIAREISDYDNVEIFHIGDHDPSGVHIHSSLDEDLQAFVDYYGGRVEVTRLAVTPAQVRAMGLPTAPPKRTDNRRFSGETTQAEAIPPRVLRQIVTDTILERLDRRAYEAVLEQEKEIQESLIERLEDL